MNSSRPRILIADPDRKSFHSLKETKSAHLYHIEACVNGSECLQKIESFAPDLLIIDLFLPHIHGIEILRKIKTDPRLKQMGVIMMSYHPLPQNYQTALHAGADYFLEKPYDTAHLATLIQHFFAGTLKPAPLHDEPSSTSHPHTIYHPKPHLSDVYLKFWGTRGSNPVSGCDYVRFGGNTCCLEITHHQELLIIDAGTGIRPLGTLVHERGIKDIHILFSHTHWDHLAGLPFFAPLYQSDCRIHIWTPIGFERSTKELFTEMLAYSYFPVRLDDIQSTIVFHEIIERCPFALGPFEIDTHYAFHPGSTLSFKITCNKKTIGYVTDNELLMGYHGHPKEIHKKHPAWAPYASQAQFFKDCDLLIHEAQYTTEEYAHKVGWGHSSIANASALIRLAEIPQWIITHHDPKHTDCDLLQKTQAQFDILDDCGIECRTRMAFDGLTIPLS